MTPRATIRSDPSGSGRSSFRASSGGAIIQVSTSCGVVRITGIAFGWMAPTSAFASVVRKAKMSLVVSPSFTFRTDVQLVQMVRDHVHLRCLCLDEHSAVRDFALALVTDIPELEWLR